MQETLQQPVPLFSGSLSALLIFDYRPPNAPDVFGLKTASTPPARAHSLFAVPDKTSRDRAIR